MRRSSRHRREEEAEEEEEEEGEGEGEEKDVEYLPRFVFCSLTFVFLIEEQTLGI